MLRAVVRTFCITFACAVFGQNYAKLGGDNQSIGTGRTFAARLQVKVTDGSGDPVPNSQITFTAPSSNAGGTFPGNATLVNVSTDQNGVATAPAFMANGTAGQYTVTTSPGNLSFSLTNTQCVDSPTVSTNADSGAGSLRDAIANACTGSTITFSGFVTGPILLSSRLRIDDDLTIQGPGAANLAIDGQSQTRLFFIGGGSVAMSGLTLQNGLAKGGNAGTPGGAGAGMGGAIFVNAGALATTAMVFQNNEALGGGNGLGGSTLGGGGFAGDAVSGGGTGGSSGDLFGSAGVGIANTVANSGGDGGGGGGAGANQNGTITGGNGGFGAGGAMFNGNGGFGGGGAVSGGVPGFAAGGSGGGGAGMGGAIFIGTGTLTLKSTQFSNNSAVGGQSSTSALNGVGKGGAVFILAGATASTSHSGFSGNTALGAGPPSAGENVGLYGIAPYQSNTTCPGQDTNDICGIISVNNFQVIAGSGQSIGTGRTFPARLQLFISDINGYPIAGQQVTFNAPTSGPSGTFAGGGTTATVATDQNGVATAPAFVANDNPGSYTVTVTGQPDITFSLTNLACTDSPTVSTNSDSGSGSLRDAITNACAGATITFAGGITSPILLTSRLRIDDDLTIQGPGALNLAIDGQSKTRLFFIGGGNVVINGLTLKNGFAKGGAIGSGGAGGGAGMGGGIFVNAGSLTTTGVLFSNNKAQGGGDTLASPTNGGGGFGGDAVSNGAIGGSSGDLFGSAGFGVLGITAHNGGDGGGGGGGGANQNGFVQGGNGGFGAGGGFPNGNGGFGGGGAGTNGSGGFAAANAGGGGAGMGGAIFIRTGTLSVNSTQFLNNSALGSAGVGSNGLGKGGALFVLAGASASVAASAFDGNAATGAGPPPTGDNVGLYGIAPYQSNNVCPGQDTDDICGIIAVPAAIVAVSPTSPQSAPVNTAFTAPLVVKVTDSSNNPVSGVPVTFSAPASGASAALTTPAVTDSNGLTSVTATANSSAGSYQVTARVAGVSTPASFNLTNTQVEQPPTIGTFTEPAGGHGTSGQFQFQFSDPNGVQDIARTWMVFNATLSPLNACQLTYIASNGRFYLMSDDSTSWVGSVPAGGNGTLSNSQCTLNGPTSTVSGSGNTLTITLDVTFTATFGGIKQVWAYVIDAEGQHAGWTDVGAWMVGPAGDIAPQLGTVTTPGAFGTAGQFQFQFSDGNGAADIARAWMLFNNNSSPVNGCQVSYMASVGRFYLLSDNGSAWVGSVAAGGGGTLQNSQCTLNAATSTASLSGNTLTITLDLTFTAAFDGAKQIWGYVLDTPGQRDGWRQISSWVVGSGAEQPPVVGSLTAPQAGAGSSAQFQFQFSDPNGSGDIARTWMLFNSTFTPAHGCQVSYIASVGRFYLLSDDGASWVGSVAAGASGTLQNSQCTLNAATSTAAPSGNTLTITLDLTFTTPGFDGVKQIWGYVVDGAGEHAGWTDAGSWTVQ